MDEKRLQVKVGLLFLAALAALGLLLWLMGEISFGSGGRMQVEFAHTGNVAQGAPVKLGGIPVGRVDSIRLQPDRRDDRGLPLPVLMTLSLTKDALRTLKSDVSVTVATLGPLGESYLELYPGRASTPLENGATVRGTDAPRLDLVANRLSSFLEALTVMVDEDPQLLAKLATGVAELTHTVDGVLTENRADLKTLVQNLSIAVQDLRVLTNDARVAMAPGGNGAALFEDAQTSARLLRRELPKLTDDAGKALGGLSNVAGAYTPEDGERLRVAVGRYAAAGERLDRLAERGERILSQIEAGKGSLGGLYRDPAVYQDLKSLVSDLKSHPWKVLWKGD